MDALGSEPSGDEDGRLCPVGYTRDGRGVIGLYGRDSGVSLPTIPEQATALHDLGRRVGLT